MSERLISLAQYRKLEVWARHNQAVGRDPIHITAMIEYEPVKGTLYTIADDPFILLEERDKYGGFGLITSRMIYTRTHLDRLFADGLLTRKSRQLPGVQTP